MARKWSKRDKQRTCVYVFVHMISIFAPFHFNWSAFWVACALYIITGLFGITISYHRHLSHRSLKLPKLFEYILAYCGVHALQGDPINWVSTHRSHHQFFDTEKDPHNPIHGFLFSHMTWMFDSNSLTKKVCPKKIEKCNEYGRADNVRDLEKQSFYRFIGNTYILHPIALAVLLYKLGGVPFLMWGMCVMIVTLLHITFMVNSICHTWGKQPWRTGDLSRNNWWMSLVSFGEGWHNNHHAFEYSARMGLELWWQIDVGWYVIVFLRAIGLATNLKLPNSQTHYKTMATL